MKRTLVAIVLLTSFPTGPGRAESPVEIPDRGLKAAIEDELWLTDPTPTDLLGLTHLNAIYRHIADLMGLEHAANLRVLGLRDNQISDLTPLSGLTQLVSLNLSMNQIDDLSPLARLSNLKNLDVHDNPMVTDISVVAEMPLLETLIIRFNSVSDISPLADANHLQHVELWGNRIRDLSPLAGLTSLSYLDVRFNPLNPEACAVHIPQIEENNPGITLVHDQCEGFFQPSVSSRNELYVDDDVSESLYKDGSPAYPFRRIQDAVEIAADGASIIIRPGTYRESINLLGKKVHLMALDPENAHGGPCATIEGLDTGPVVRIPAGSGAECSLMGLIITRGRGPDAGAIHCTGSSPTVTNCLIVGNRCSDSGGALVFENSRAVVSHCTIADNYGGQEGAGVALVNSSVTILNSILWDNQPGEIRSRGTGDLLVRYCCVRGGWPGDGNIDEDPLFTRQGSWANPANLKETLGPEDPSATWVDGDYHLRSQAGRWDPAIDAWVYDGSTSPCTDAGDRDNPVEHEPQPNGGIVNVGAYGGTSEASRSPAPASWP